MKNNYAENVNYWQSSRTSPDTWLDKTINLIVKAGGKMLGSGMFTDYTSLASGYMLSFVLDNEKFMMRWPILESKSGNIKAARIQSATALYHEVKNACVRSKFLGVRTAFFAYLTLPNGSILSEIDFTRMIPMNNEIINEN